MASIFAELKRRNVLRAFVAYVVVAWVIMEAGSLLFSVLELPAWTSKALLAALALGLIPALILSWLYELTPDGLRPSRDVIGTGLAEATGKRMDRLVVAMVVVGIAFVVGDRLWTTPETGDAVPVFSGDPAIESGLNSLDSIAVLPFVNMSNDPEQEFLGDGLAEELLNALARKGNLKVAARTSSFSFKGKDTDIRVVGEALNVDTVLEGSVRRAGNRVRISAQLIEVAGGYHLWSETYDRELEDIFDIQDEITGRIMLALNKQLDGMGSQVATAPVRAVSPELYERFLWARHKLHDNTRESVENSHREFQAITEIAPDFAAAWAMLANTWLLLEQGDDLGDIPPATAFPAARQAIDTALALDPNETMAMNALGHLLIHLDHLEQAEAAYLKALDINPAQVETRLRLSSLLFFWGREQEALQALREAHELDPLHPRVLWNMAHETNLRNDRETAFEFLKRLYAVNASYARSLEIHLYRDNGDGARAVWLARVTLDEAPGEPERRKTLARQLQWLGIHEDPIAQEEAENYVSLAALGRREEALRAAESAFSETSDPWLRGSITWRTRLALGDRQAALDDLWRRWNEAPDGKLTRTFDFRDGMALAALLKDAGRTADLAAVLELLGPHVQMQSAAWTGGKRMFEGYLALLRNELALANRLLDAEAATGAAGFGGFGTALPHFGTVLPFDWLFSADPGLTAVLLRFEDNRQQQLRLLVEWQRKDFNIEQLRTGYLAAGSADRN